MVAIAYQLYSNSNRNHEMFSFMIRGMEENFLKYYRNIPLLYCLNCVLDPKVKFTSFEKLIDALITFTGSSTTHSDYLKELIKNILQ